MSYTVVIDEREREQRFENRVNELFRHCRIGRVRRKMMIHGGDMVPMSWGKRVGSPTGQDPKLPWYSAISTP